VTLVEQEGTKATESITVTDLETGQYNATFLQTRSGTYWLFTSLSGRTVSNLQSCEIDTFTSKYYLQVRPRNPSECAALQRCNKLRIERLGFGAGRQETVLERETNPKISRRACTCEYGLLSCRGESAGIAKRPRERSLTPKSLTSRFAPVFIAVCPLTPFRAAADRPRGRA
jgi:hypothetical protein